MRSAASPSTSRSPSRTTGSRATRASSYRLYIPTGIQHMDGAQALKYARSRHSSTDFDRGQRQQRVLLSLREQADPQNLIPRLPELIAALKKTVRTDVPLEPDGRAAGPGLRGRHKNIRSYVFSPPLYSQDTCADPRGCVVIPNIERIKDAVKNAFTADPGRRGPAPDARGRGRRGLGPQRHRRQRPRFGPRRLSRLPRRRGVGAAPEAGGCRPGQHPDRRLQRRRGADPRRRSPTSRRRSESRSRSSTTRRSAPTSSSRSATGPRRSAPPPGGRDRALSRRPGGRPRRSAGASPHRLGDGRQPVLVLGQLAAHGVEVAVAQRAGRSARSRPTRPRGGPPR